jgi:Domain of unknown function (DUF1844)
MVEANEEPDSQTDVLPSVDFATFVLSLSHSALVHLGQAANPDTGRIDQSLPLARQTIDLIAMLEDKTRGNLSGDEERLVGQILFDLRMRYVELTKSK